MTGQFLLAVFAAWGSDLPMRRHAKESRPVFHQGRSMSVIFPHSLSDSVWLIGTVECPAATHRANSACAGCYRRFAGIVLDRALVTILILSFGVGAAIAAAPQSLSIDLSHQQIGSPPPDFEFWRAGEAGAATGRWSANPPALAAFRSNNPVQIVRPGPRLPSMTRFQPSMRRFERASSC